MPEILIITNYYPPETGAASNRIHQLATGLQQAGYKLKVLTPLPNYPRGKIFEEFKGKLYDRKTEKGIEVNRLWIFASNSKNILLRLLAMLSFSLSLIWYLSFHRLPRIIIVQSPPLLVAFTALQLLRFKKGVKILNVSDLWPLAGLELGALKPGLSYRLLQRIERSNYKRASLIMGQSEEILSHVSKLFHEKSIHLYRNFPEFELPELTDHVPEVRIKMVYAGLLGVAQGILKLCKNLDYNRVEFHIYGDGAEKNSLETFIKEHPDKPVFYHGEIDRGELHKALLCYDLAVIPLLNRIYGSVPSKIFEFSRLGMPLLYFGGGEGENIVRDNSLGWIAKAGDYNDLNKVISTISLSELDDEKRRSVRANALSQFDFKSQLHEFINRLKRLN